jgi:hypothetical protein
VGRSLFLDDGSDVYSCCWPSPAQSFSGPSPVGLATILYCLRFEPPTTRRVTVEVFDPASTRDTYYVFVICYSLIYKWKLSVQKFIFYFLGSSSLFNDIRFLEIN